MSERDVINDEMWARMEPLLPFSTGKRGGQLWLTGGNINHTTELEAVPEGIRVPRPVGRPRTTPDRVIADKGYSSRSNRKMLAGRGIKVTIPERKDQKGHRLRRGSAGGRPYAFDAEVHGLEDSARPFGVLLFE